MLGQTSACPACHRAFVVVPFGSAPGASAAWSPPPAADDFWSALNVPQNASQVPQYPSSAPQTSSSRQTSADYYDIHEGRVYIHKNCGQATCINNEDFVGLCNPLYYSRGTFCAYCERPDTFDRFVWDDTGETISTYRDRLKRNAPAWMQNWRLLAIGLGIFLGIAFIPIAAKGAAPQLSDIIVAMLLGVFASYMLFPQIMGFFREHQFYKNR